MAIRIDVVVVVIDRGDESGAFIPFVGMPIAPCFKTSYLGVRPAVHFFPVGRRVELDTTGPFAQLSQQKVA